VLFDLIRSRVPMAPVMASLVALSMSSTLRLGESSTGCPTVTPRHFAPGRRLASFPALASLSSLPELTE